MRIPATRLSTYLLAAVAALAVAWFAIGARQAHLVDAATKLLDANAGTHPATRRQTESLLRSAAFLNPGVDVTLARARLAMEQHDFARAKPLVDRALADEPDNLQAWISELDLAVADANAVDVRRVVSNLRRLDPVDARHLKP